MAYKDIINQLRSSEEYAKLPERKQYELQLRVLAQSLSENHKFQQATPEARKVAMSRIMDETFQPVYENPDVGLMTDQMIAAYKAGDPAARQGMISYSQGSYYNERMATSLRFLRSGIDPVSMNASAGIPDQYANSVLAVNKTKGADDNKTRAAFQRAMKEMGDEQALDELNMSKINRNAILTRVGEGLLIGLATAATAGVATGIGAGGAAAAGTAAKAGVGLKAVMATFLAKSAPFIAVEAGLEGTLGVGEYVADQLQTGEAASVRGAAKAFGTYAALDVLANVTLSTAIPIAKYIGMPYILGKGKQSKEALSALSDGLRKGYFPSKGMADIARPEIKAHYEAIKLYESTTAGLKTSADLEGLTELQRLNYDAFEIGHSVYKNDAGKYVVATHDDLATIKEFDNIFTAKDYVANASVNKRLQAKIKEGTIEDIASYIERHATTVKRQTLRDAIDNKWTLSNPPKRTKYTQPFTRELVAPEEVDELMEGMQQGILVRFDTPVNVKQVRSGKRFYSSTDDVRISPEMLNPNGNTFVALDNVASPNDWKKAMTQGAEAAERSNGEFTAEQWAKDRLIGANYQAAVDDTGTLIPFFPDRFKIVSNRVNPKTSEIGNIVPRKQPIKTTIQARTTAQAPAREVAMNPDALAKLSSNILSGDIDEKSIEVLAKTIALRNTKKALPISVSSSADDVTRVFKDGDTIRVMIPRNLDTHAKQQSAFSTLIQGIDRQTGGTGSLHKYIKAFRKMSTQGNIPMSIENKRKWVNVLLQDSKVTKNITTDANGFKWDVLYDPQTAATYTQRAKNIDELTHKLTIQSMEPELLENQMKRQGYEIAKDATGVTVKYNDNAFTGINIHDAAANAGFIPDKVPSSLAPKMVMISKVPTLELQLNANEVLGEHKEVLNFISQFEDSRKAAFSSVLTTKPDGSEMIKLKNNLYQVNVPAIKHNLQFTSAKDARKYINGSWKTYTNLQDAAQTKGMRMSYEDGNFVLRSSNKKIICETPQEVYENLAKVETPSFGKSFVPTKVQAEFDNLGIDVELPPGFGKITTDAADDMPLDPNLAPSSMIAGDLRDIILPKRAAIQRNLKNINNPQLTRTFNIIENQAPIAKLKHQNYANKAMEILGGMDNNKRKGITYWLEAENPEMVKKVIEDYGLKPSDISAAESLRQLYKDIGDELAIPFLDRITHYGPRIRKAFNDIDMSQVTEGLTQDFFNTPQGRKIFKVPEIKRFFARFERVNDLVDFARDDDALSVFLTYSKRGHNEFYLRKGFDQLNDVLRTEGDNLTPSNMRILLQDYEEALTHGSNTLSQKVLNQSAARLMKKFGLDAQNAKRWVDLGVNMSYMTNMSWRPWQPFRNIWQVYNVLPLKTGNPAITTRAIKKFVQDPNKLHGQMLARGIYPDDASKAAQLQQLYDGQFGKGLSRVLKFGQDGLGWFKASDYSTRIVAALSADELMEKAWQKCYINGKLDTGKFLKLSRLETFSPSVQQNVLSFAEAGKKQAAMDIYAREMVNETMFDYTKANKPLAAKGVLGSLYYQYMTYPLNLAQSIGKAMSNGSTSSKVKSLIALGAGMSAIAGAMKGLGIDNSQFLTWNQVSISGGPLWNDLYLLTQLREEGMVGAEARATYLGKLGLSQQEGEIIFNKYPQILPGRIQARNFMKAVEAADRGDWYLMMLYLTTTPPDKSWAEWRG